MFIRLLLMFTLIPLIELYLLIRIGSMFGALPTILIVLGTGALGAFLARMQGFQVWLRIQKSLEEGRFPADELVDGVLVFAAGLVLITPGILTDILGFLLLIPFTRKYFRRWLVRRFSTMVRKSNANIAGGFPQDSQGPQEPHEVRNVTDSAEDRSE